MSIFNKVFDFDFFGNKAKKKIELLNSIIDIKDTNYDTLANSVKSLNRLYKNIIYSNNIVTVVFNDGLTISVAKPIEIIEQIKSCTSQDEILQLLKPKQEVVNVEKEEEQVIAKFTDLKEEILDFLGSLFSHSNNNFYYNNIDVPISAVLLNSLIEAKKADNVEYYNALIGFFLKLCLNPVKETRDTLFQIIKNYDVKLTNSGNFLGYRNVWKVENKDTELLEYVSEQYFKKKRHKKSPSNYTVCLNLSNKLGTFKNSKIEEFGVLVENHIVGNLKELYESLQKSNDNRYTDDYTRKQDIRIGSVYKLPENFDFNNRHSCGGALHCSMGVSSYDYSSFGDTSVVAIVNPMHVYRMDTGCRGKIGVKQMFIAAKEDEANIEEHLVNFDEIYHNETIEELENSLKNKSFDNIVTQLEEVPVIRIVDLNSITDSLKKKIVSF